MVTDTSNHPEFFNLKNPGMAIGLRALGGVILCTFVGASRAPACRALPVRVVCAFLRHLQFPPGPLLSPLPFPCPCACVPACLCVSSGVLARYRIHLSLQGSRAYKSLLAALGVVRSFSIFSGLALPYEYCPSQMIHLDLLQPTAEQTCGRAHFACLHGPLK